MNHDKYGYQFDAFTREQLHSFAIAKAMRSSFHLLQQSSMVLICLSVRIRRYVNVFAMRALRRQEQKQGLL